LVLVLAAGAGIAIATRPGIADTGLVTDPEQGILLPASKEADIQAIEGDPSAPAETTSSADVADPSDTTAPAPVTAALVADSDSNGDLAAPMPDSVLTSPTNTYRAGDSTTLTSVYAGADGQDPATGILIQIDINYSTGAGTTVFTRAPSGSGAITVSSFSGNTLYFITAARQTGTYTLDTHQITMCPIIIPCGS